MPSPYYEPRSIAPILQEGLRAQTPYLTQPMGGMQAALPALGQVTDAAFGVQKKRSVMAQQQAYADYLAKVDAGTATPDDHKTATIAALGLGLPPPAQSSVAPDIWGSIQNAAGVSTHAPGTKDNVAATEVLARIKAAKDKADKPKFGELSQTQQEAVEKALTEARLAPAQITRGPKLVALANQFLKDPTYNASGADITFDAGKTGAGATARVKGGKGFELDATVGSLDDTLRQMEPLVAKLSPTSVSALNDAWQRGLAQTNDAGANQVLALANSARGLYSQVVAGGGAGTVDSDKKANETIGRGLTSEGFRGMKAAVLAEGYSRSGRMTGRISPDTAKPAGYIDPNGAAAPAAAPPGPKKAAIGYKIGEVRGGYTYLGGDPREQANWQVAK